jgi:hypothetical protein
MGEARVMLDRTTDGVATVSLTVPLWALSAHDIFVQWVVPALGAAWLVMQMYFKLKNELKKDNNGS